MCEKDALANRILDFVERYGVDENGRLDRDKAHVMVAGCLERVDLTWEDDEDEVSSLR